MNEDMEEAPRLYRVAAEQEDADAMVNLADCYRDGEGVEQDYAEALKWYRKLGEVAVLDAALEERAAELVLLMGKELINFSDYLLVDRRKELSAFRERLREKKTKMGLQWVLLEKLGA